MAGGAPLVRYALAGLALLVALFVAIGTYLLMSAELGVSQLVLALVIQGLC